MPHVPMLHEYDPRQMLLKEVGDISEIEVFHNQILVAIYKRPEMTEGGIVLPKEHLDEDNYQSKVGLILKMGPDACNDPEGRWYTRDQDKLRVGDWIVYQPSAGWSLQVNKVLCRQLQDTSVRMRVQHPDAVY